MSYAEVAAKGPKQTPQEARAPVPPIVEKMESDGTASLTDLGSPHVVSVHSSFEDQSVKTTTQAQRIQMEHEEDVTQRDVRTSTKRSKANRENLRYNSKNPVVLGNALLIAGISATLGYGAYQRQKAGKLSWEIISWWTGAVGLFATADYFVSKWFVQNKYPLNK